MQLIGANWLPRSSGRPLSFPISIQYIVRLIAAGGNIPLVVIMRLAVVAMHFGTTAIQNYYHKKAIETGDESNELTGYMIAVGVHSVWNFVGILVFA